MSLKKYHAKRNFAKTPEPKGAPSKPGKQLVFVVQEHNATRLHYDFRLECDGVLKSWAVPKGPSMNPHDRHLAIMTEDHPFEYRKFEGVIPAGNYGAGEVIIWDEGTYQARGGGGEAEIRQGLKKGHITFVVSGKKLHGEFALIRLPKGGDDTWLLIKKGDDAANTADITTHDESVVSGKTLADLHGPHSKIQAPKGRMPQAVAPMLATLVDAPFSKPGWLFELKWDGYRAIATKHGSDVQLYSRNGLDFTERYAPVVEALHTLKKDVVLDGEIVVVDENGVSHFEWMQNYARQPNGSLHYYAFDILWCDGRDLRGLPLTERKEILKSVIPSRSVIRYSDHVETQGDALFTQAQKAGLEGIVAKRADSTYQTGVRGHDWLKIKTHLRQEAVIGGFTEPRGSRQHLGSLLLGVYQKGAFTFIGHSGGGIPTQQLKTLRAKLNKLEQKTSPFVNPPKVGETTHWVKPQLVCEASFSEWTGEGLMRHPKFEGLRDDKSPKNVHKEPIKRRTALVPGVKKAKKADHATLPGSRVAFSHLDKIFWPERGYTKGDLITYYQTVGDTMLKYLKDRPESLKRQPGGYKDDGFFQKDITMELPKFASSTIVYSESTNENVHYLVCNNVDTLLYMVQLGCIEINPWNSRTKNPDKPDWAVMDLDPEGVTFAQVVKVARTVHDVCQEWGVTALPKTSGKTGIHIFIPLGAKYSYAQARQFTQLIGIEVNKRLPKLTSLERSPDKRHNRVYLDYLQNSKGQTLAAPYSARPTRDATVSTPLHWDEVNANLKPTNFTIKNMPARLKKVGDLWGEALGKGVDIAKIIGQLGAA